MIPIEGKYRIMKIGDVFKIQQLHCFAKVVYRHHWVWWKRILGIKYATTQQDVDWVNCTFPGLPKATPMFFDEYVTFSPLFDTLESFNTEAEAKKFLRKINESCN